MQPTNDENDEKKSQDDLEKLLDSLSKAPLWRRKLVEWLMDLFLFKHWIEETPLRWLKSQIKLENHDTTK